MSRDDWQAVPDFSDIVGTNQVVICRTPSAGGPAFFRGKVWLGDASELESGDFRLWMTRAGGQTLVSFVVLGSDLQGRNRYYTLEHATNLVAGSWQVVPGCSNVLGTLQTVTHVVTNLGSSPGFYRARLELRNP